MSISHSPIAGIHWPEICALDQQEIFATLKKLEKTQWWDAEKIRDYQFRQLREVLFFASQTIPFYHDRLAEAGINPLTVNSFDQLQEIPLLTRKELQDTNNTFQSNFLPTGHGKTFEVTTSGSTGSPVKIVKTEVNTFFQKVSTLRCHLWYKRDFFQKFASIRSLKIGQAIPPHGLTQTSWGSSSRDIFETGPSATLNIKSNVKEQSEWLARHNPGYFMSYPSNILLIAKYFIANGLELPALLEVMTFGEIIEPKVREACQAAWNVPVADQYSSQEVGVIALQCPKHEHYHVQSESLIIEILNDQDQPCCPGEVGRIIITTLHNFAMPLIRYDIGDYAEVGEPCSCGRGLPVLKRIIGRQRQLFTLPDGSKIQPSFGRGASYDLLAPFHQFQVIQWSLDDIEVKLVPARPFTDYNEEKIKKIFQDACHYSCNIRITYCDEIPRNKADKYEDYMSYI